MKLILSRKGFDSSAGGYPSPIFPDGAMLSLPIPSKSDSSCYSSIKYHDLTYYDIMKGLNQQFKVNAQKTELTKDTKCHVDPDLVRSTLGNRPKGWRPSFGQVGAAGGHLINQNVEPGDIFLFYGLFRHVIQKKKGSGYEYAKGADPIHVIFGYLQIDQIFEVNTKFNAPSWLNGHPHLIARRRVWKNNTIYVGRKKLKLSDIDLPGAGVFPLFDRKYQLSAPGKLKSTWRLPKWMDLTLGNITLTYHPNKSRSTNDGRYAYLQSTARGQEFVMTCNRPFLMNNWLKGLFEHSNVREKCK